MGDVILTTGVVAALSNRFPGARIDYLTRSPHDQLLREEKTLENVIALPRKESGKIASFRQYIHFLRYLRQNRYDLVIDFFSRGPRSRIITFATRAPFRLGLVDRGFPGHYWIDPVIYTRISSPPVQLALTVDRMNHLLSRIFSLATLPSPSSSPTLTVTDNNIAAAQEVLMSSFSGERPLFLIFCGSGIPTKNWPAQNFAEIARRLVDRGVGVLFLGAASDHRQMERVRENIENPTGVIFQENLPFGTLKGLCRLSIGILGNDSGPLHLAQATGQKVVVLFGPGDHVSYAPFHGRFLKANLACQPCQAFANHCSDNRCMQEISVEDVWHTLLETFEIPGQRTRGESVRLP